MATYYPSSSNQRDSPYHDSACLPDNMMYLNQTSTAASYSENLSGSNLSQYYSVEIPSVGSRDEMVFIPPTGEPMNTQQVGQQLNMTADLPVDDSVIRETQMLSRTTDHILDGEQNFQYQELSLSLGMQIPSPFNMPSFQYNYTNSCPSYSLSSHVPDPGECGSQSNELRKDESSSFDLAGGTHNTIRIGALDNLQCSISPKGMQSLSHLYEPSGLGCTISNSKYLKAAQQLLDELVNVHEALKQPKSDKHQNFLKLDPDGSKEAGELSPDERKNLHSKMTKLSSMLDEVDRRYNQYKNQMQFVEASFEVVAGCGAAKSYTRLALLTISRHFRCLRDAICRQIEVTCRSLGEQDDTLSTRVLPRLRYVDKKLRQQRTLQQLGVVQHSWRPQRGLPENSVSILRAWLFEHFLHPYPKDSEKIMLARQTGLTRSQVANWFINARVRLWKPMVEDMYKEEFGADSEAEFKSSPKHASNEAGDKSWTSEDRGEELLKSVTSGPADGGRMGKLWESKPDLVCDVEMNGYTAGLSFTNVTHGDDNIYYGMMNLHGNQRPDTDDQKVCPEEIITLNQSGAESLKAADATYNISALGSFAVGNQVSLALGLQHSEKDPPPMPEGTELKGDEEEASPVGPDHVDHHHVDMVNQYRFCNPHLLPDFVA